jgi:alkanesulfonate monooxygenase SsuD/methylene tetrahydromethanopterin reductase-like flavin-dependent oxidoreductase (luciferase family)
MVGRMGYSIFVSVNTPIPQLQERLALYRQAWQEAGHTGAAEVAVRLPLYVADTAEKARVEPEASMWHEIRYGARQLSASAASAEVAERLQRVANSSYDDLLKQRVLFGTPEAVVDRLQQYQEELGLTGVVAEVNYGGQIPYDQVLHSIRLLTDKVIPKFK